MQELVGKVIGGVRIDKKLGQGGMGAVYKGTQVSLGREVAVKVIAEQFMSNEQAVARFEREARSVAQLNAPNIVQVYDLGHTEEGQYYIIMEFIDGPSLSSVLKERGSIPEREALVMIQQAAKGLAAAAEKKIIHRDIKPDNLMITSKGVVKVADFGLAKDVGSASQLTASGHIMGTPAYIAPEQGDGRTSDHRSDIYSLGATLFAMVTGEMPYTGETPIAIVMQHISAPVPDPKLKKPDLSDSACKIIRKMMAKKLEERYQKAEELIHDIDVVLGAAKDGARLIAEGASVTFDEQMTMGGVAGLTTQFESGKAETLMEVSAPTPHTIDAKLIRKRTQAGGRGTGFYVALVAVVLIVVGGGLAAIFMLKDRGKPGTPGPGDSGTSGVEKKEDPGEASAKKTEPEPGKKDPGKVQKTEPGKTEPPVGPPPAPKIDVAITMPGTGSFHRVRALTVKGRCGPGAKVLKINGSPAALGPDGSFVEKIEMPEGASEVKVSVDGDNQAHGEAMVDVVVDTKPPVLAIKGHEPGKVARTNRPSLTIEGTMSDLNPAQISVNGRPAALNGEAFEAEVGLEEGMNAIRVEAEDQVGNKAAETVRVFLDTVKPVLQVDPVPARTVQESPELALKGSANEDLRSLALDGKPVSVEGRGFTAVLALKPGANRFVLAATDLAGNEATRVLETEFRALPAALAPGSAPGLYVHRVDGAEMVEVPAGTYGIGSAEGGPDERPPHEVVLKTFFIDRKEATNAQYAKFLEALAKETEPRAYSHPDEPAGKDHTPAFWDDPEYNRPDLPVVGVDWFDAWAFAKWAGKSLASEAEWEAAAGAGSGTRRPAYPWGDEAPDGRALFGDAEGAPRPPGSFPTGASKIGLLDMAGNVQEWCLDWYDAGFYASPESRSPNCVNETKGKARVMRGGHFQSPAAKLRITARSYFFPTGRYETVGFRCVLRLP